MSLALWRPVIPVGRNRFPCEPNALAETLSLSGKPAKAGALTAPPTKLILPGQFIPQCSPANYPRFSQSSKKNRVKTSEFPRFQSCGDWPREPDSMTASGSVKPPESKTFQPSKPLKISGHEFLGGGSKSSSERAEKYFFRVPKTAVALRIGTLWKTCQRFGSSPEKPDIFGVSKVIERWFIPRGPQAR